MRKSAFVFVAAFLGTLSGQVAQAQSTATLLYSQDFGTTLANGTAITTANVPNNGGTSTTTKGLTLVAGTVTATSGQFSGVSAQISGANSSLTWQNGSGTASSAIKIGVFDFSVFSSSTLSAFQVFLGSGMSYTLSGMANSDVVAGLQFTGGQLQSRVSDANNTVANVGSAGFFAGNTAYNFSIVFNDATTNFNYAAGAGYLAGAMASRTADVYVNGTLFADNLALAGDAQNSVADLRLGTTSSTASVVVDNLQLYKLTATPTPEPSTLALATLGGIACFFAVRRRS